MTNEIKLLPLSDVDFSSIFKSMPAMAAEGIDEDLTGKHVCAWCGKPTANSPSNNPKANFAKPSLHDDVCDLAWKDDQCFNQARSNIEKYAAGFKLSGLASVALLDRMNKAHKPERLILEAREVIKTNVSATFIGDTGRGKSSLAVATIQELLELGRKSKRGSVAWQVGVNVRFYPGRVLARARANNPLGKGEPDEVTDALKSSVLLIDELGSELPTFGSAIADVIMDRYDTNKPIWVTTGLTPEEMTGRYGSAISRRLIEQGAVLKFGRDVKKEAVK